MQLPLNILQKISLVSALLSSALYGAEFYLDDDEDFLSLQTDMDLTDEVEECCVEVDEGCYNFFVRADFLYWRACEDGFDSNELGFSRVDGMATLFTAENKEPDFKWHPGFRLGVGYESLSRGWDLAAYWTHYQAHQDSWKLKYNVLDLIMSYHITSYCHPCFEFIPFWGLRVDWVNQRFSSTVESNLLAEGITNSSSRINDKQNFWGIGPELGFEATYELGRGWGLFGGVAGALLYGNSNFKRTLTTDLVLSTDPFRNSHNHCVCQYAFDGELGIRWSTYFCNEARHLTLQAGWEQHTLFDFNQIGDGDLNLYGLVIAASFHW